MKKIKKILKYISNILIGIMVIFCLYAVVNTAVLGKKYVKVFNHTFFVVSSGSMLGSININDIIIVKLTNDVKVNDIITYEEDNYFITHRVVSVNGDKIVTRGDANTSDDNPIDINDVLGKVVFIFSIRNFLIILGMIILLIIIIMIFNFEKIFNKFFIKKKIEQAQNDIDKKSLKIYEDDFNDFYIVINKLIAIMKSREKTNKKDLNITNWLIRLKYVTKAMELIKTDSYRLLKVLVDDYKINMSFEKATDLSYDFIVKMSNLSLDSHLILLLNAITYQDRDMYNLIFVSFKTKVTREYNLKFPDNDVINNRETKILEYIKNSEDYKRKH